MVDNGTTVVPEAYRAMAAQMGQNEGIAYRYGPDPAAYGNSGNTGVPTLFKRNDTAFVSDRDGGQRACIPGLCGTWQLGSYVTTAGNYSSNFGHVGYIADNAATNQGVAGLQFSAYGHNTFAQSPELSWTLYGDGVNEVNMMRYKQDGLDASRAVAVARAYGRPNWGVGSVAAFQNGLLAVAGNNTATNKATAQLEAGKVPTAVALTNGGEFALVTVWDTVNVRGQVAVVALAGRRNLADTAENQNWWGEWNDIYPGLPNLGNIGFMKVLGYVDLPEMKAPTEITVSTGWNPWDGQTHEPGAFPQTALREPYALPLTDETVRQSFRDGGSNQNAYAKVGVAVVISKSEKKASFIDLKPLLDHYRRSYFDGSAADLAAALRDRGTGAEQWPQTFARVPAQKPQVVRTIALPDKPTAVKATLWGNAKRAFIATQDGRLRIYRLDSYLTPGTAGNAASIEQVGEVAVGRNPTGLTYVRDHITENGGRSLVYPSLNELIVVSRGDRRIDWVRGNGDFSGGSVVRTLRDTRLVDPISAEDTDNNGTESYVLAVADYSGKQVANYRYGPVVFRSGTGATYPVQGTNGVEIEFGGAFKLPGRPFQVTSANVP